MSVGHFCHLDGLTDFLSTRQNMKRILTITFLIAAAALNATVKMDNGFNNPIADYMFFADPTCVEHEGRLYVYGTNDSQQMELTSPDSPNTYEKIHSFCVVSTDDMVNWTYHGTIDVSKAAPKCSGVAWAPSIVSRKESDGLTHFYMYYSSSGSGVGLITSTSPVGPWHDPIGREFVLTGDQEIGDCPNPFDPGVMIDDNGVGWLAFGAGKSTNGSDYYPGSQRIVKLSDDMIHPASDFIEIKAPYHFEANELNHIGGKYVYIYNTSWVDRNDWDFTEVDTPTACCMSYMTSPTPLISESWQYEDNILRNPGDEGFEHSNNHTHLHKYKGEWYIFYHTLCLQRTLGVTGGYRSICVDKIEVDEKNAKITRGTMTAEGVKQLKRLDVSKPQPASQASATDHIVYEESGIPGEMIVHATGTGQCFKVSGILSPENAESIAIKVKGNGKIKVHAQNPAGPVLATVEFDCNDWREIESGIDQNIKITNDICFTFEDGDFLFKEWRII